MSLRPQLLACALLHACGTGPAPAEDFHAFHENVLGTSLELRIQANSDVSARAAEAAALAEIDRLAHVFSTYDPTSEFSTWQAATDRPVPVSRDLWNILVAADACRELTHGAFDPRAGAAIRAWQAAAPANTTALRGRACRGPCSPHPPGLAPRHSRPNRHPPLTRSPDPRRHRQGLHRRTCSRSRPQFSRCRWRARQSRRRPPRGRRDRSLGGSRRTLERLRIRRSPGCLDCPRPLHRHVRLIPAPLLIAGHSYSHILDPRTTQPAQVLQATVVARDGAQADALATAFNVLPPAESLRIADNLPDVAALIVTAGGQVLRSARWAALETSLSPDPQGAPTTSSAPLELAVDFEINRPANAGSRYRRPYVVIWVEDENGQAVRTLLAWISMGGAGPTQWLPDLARWHKGDRTQSSADRVGIAFTIGRPTRPPGKYSASWDGNDDQGRPAGPGPYTLLIETAREHGTHQLLRSKPFRLDGTPEAQDLPGNEEIRSARVLTRPRQRPQSP